MRMFFSKRINNGRCEQLPAEHVSSRAEEEEVESEYYFWQLVKASGEAKLAMPRYLLGARFPSRDRLAGLSAFHGGL